MRTHRTPVTNEGIHTVSITYDISTRADIRIGIDTEESASAREIARLRRELSSALMSRYAADAAATEWMERYEAASSKVREMRDAIDFGLLATESSAADVLRRVHGIAGGAELLR